MPAIEKLKAALASHKDELKKNYKVNENGIFGSYVRNEQTQKSDVDVLVTFSETIDLLGVKVDLVMKDGIKPRLKERILSEAVYV
ncbi:MAG: nucleotidyltransferase family protein [Candidatus Bathyarchaeia archaeon]|jgi:predicted nucleotidyltransferase